MGCLPEAWGLLGPTAHAMPFTPPAPCLTRCPCYVPGMPHALHPADCRATRLLRLRLSFREAVALGGGFG